ncbi:DUF4839 domain-containing protein [Bacillaceae bacterium S4-13-58]
MMQHGNYKTRYNILILAGDYGETTFSGPNFQFENVNVVLDLNLTIFRDENTKLTYVWKGILSLALIYILANSAIKTFGVLVLNLAVAATVVLFFLFIGYFLTSIFNNEDNEVRG